MRQRRIRQAGHCRLIGMNPRAHVDQRRDHLQDSRRALPSISQRLSPLSRDSSPELAAVLSRNSKRSRPRILVAFSSAPSTRPGHNFPIRRFCRAEPRIPLSVHSTFEFPDCCLASMRSSLPKDWNCRPRFRFCTNAVSIAPLISLALPFVLIAMGGSASRFVRGRDAPGCAGGMRKFEHCRSLRIRF